MYIQEFLENNFLCDYKCQNLKFLYGIYSNFSLKKVIFKVQHITVKKVIFKVFQDRWIDL